MTKNSFLAEVTFKGWFSTFKIWQKQTKTKNKQTKKQKQKEKTQTHSGISLDYMHNTHNMGNISKPRVSKPRLKVWK